MDKITDDMKNLNINKNNKHKKNKYKNRDTNENNTKETEQSDKPKEELTEEEKFKEELNNIKDKIRELKFFFCQNEPKNINEDKLENFIIIEKIIDYAKIKQKLTECFTCQDIYDYLSEAWNKILQFSCTNKTNNNNDNNNAIIEDNENYEDIGDKKDKKMKNRSITYTFNKLLMYLDFFVPKIITDTKDDSFKNKIADTIFPNIHLIKSIEEGENFLYYFVDIFGIKDILKLKFEKEYKDKIVVDINTNICFGINLINLLDLQEMFPLEKIFKIISDNYFLISYRMYSLLVRTYIKNDEKKKFLIIDNLFKLLEDNKNLISYQLVYDIINKDFKNDDKKNELILKFVKNIKINFDKLIHINSLDNAIYYCKLIFENSHLFNKTIINQARRYICEQYFNNLKVNDWNKNLKKLNMFEYNDLKDYLSYDNLETLYYKLPLTSMELIKLLKFMPEEIPKILNDLKKDRNYEHGIRIIRQFDLPYNKVPEFFLNERLYKFFNYKITHCKEENNPHTLIEYCLISQKTFDISIAQLVNRYFKYHRKDNFFLYVINEVYYGAIDKKYRFIKRIKNQIEEEYYKIKYVDKYSFEDRFGPVDNNCMQINPIKTDVAFINKVSAFENYLKQYFIDSKYIGIDCEWQQSLKIKDEVDLSIMQLCTDDDKCCLILDMLELKDQEKFYEIFKKYLSGKIFVGFSFDKNDLEVLPSELKDFFEDDKSCTVYDLVLIYKQIYMEKCQSLKISAEKILGTSLCKYEQCSDWNIRPLSKCQMHYAALDALICIKLYKKLVDNI